MSRPSRSSRADKSSARRWRDNFRPMLSRSIRCASENSGRLTFVGKQHWQRGAGGGGDSTQNFWIHVWTFRCRWWHVESTWTSRLRSNNILPSSISSFSTREPVVLTLMAWGGSCGLLRQASKTVFDGATLGLIPAKATTFYISTNRWFNRAYCRCFEWKMVYDVPL